MLKLFKLKLEMQSGIKIVKNFFIAFIHRVNKFRPDRKKTLNFHDNTITDFSIVI